jgi:hypothetical protein
MVMGFSESIEKDIDQIKKYRESLDPNVGGHLKVKIVSILAALEFFLPHCLKRGHPNPQRIFEENFHSIFQDLQPGAS